MTFDWLVLLFAPVVLSLSLQPEPKLTISPDANPLQKPAGQQVSFLCSVERAYSNSKPGLHWTKNGGVISSVNAKMTKLDDFTISLTIQNARSEDSGVYACQVQLDDRILQKTVDVVIFEDYHFVDKTTSTGTVMATAAVNISCEVSPKGESFLTIWSRPAHPMWTPGTKHRLYKLGAILEISNYDPQTDAGDYRCKVIEPASGVTLTRKIVVGSEQENKRMFCTNMCTNVCHQLYQSPSF